MRPWRLTTTLLRLALVILVAIGPAAGTRADQEQPATGSEGPSQGIVPTGNNVVGLNVARLRNDRYVYAAADLVNANGGLSWRPVRTRSGTQGWMAIDFLIPD